MQFNFYSYSFNTQPPEGGWESLPDDELFEIAFQHTAARRRLGFSIGGSVTARDVSTHSRPKAAGTTGRLINQPKRFQHTAARRRLANPLSGVLASVLFQHTAARRRLAICTVLVVAGWVFQHTAARRRLACCWQRGCYAWRGFNTQPPEGGWKFNGKTFQNLPCFNTQPPEGGWSCS